MYRTDKQFMKNPATASQRIYIGGLQNTVVADDLEIKFRQHGKILGLVLQRGFAFIQYDTDDQAQKAIRMEQGAIIHGKKIVVKPAMSDRNRAPMNQTNVNIKPPEQNIQHKPPLIQNQQANEITRKEPEAEDKTPEVMEPECASPPHIKEQELEMLAEKFQEDEQQIDHPPKPLSAVSSEHDEDTRNPERNQIKKRPIGGRGGGMGPGGGPRNKRRDDRFPPHPPPLDRDRFRGGPGQFFPPQDRFLEFEKPPPLMDRPERNDCEIIVVSKLLTEYAEYIESRLKALGLIVDLLFPNEDVPIGRVLANISSRGCLYAILVMPLNKENQSLTLNVLHGVPQEHRNMPAEDAFLYMTRNFEAYMRGDKLPSGENGSQMTIYDKHPNSVQLLLNMLTENRLLTSIQYDKLLKYLEEKRELQVQFEISEGIEVSAENSASKQAELQNRIMSILNNQSMDPKMEADPEPPPPPTSSSSPPPLLKDPTVQKAIDSLLLGDMFKNIATG